MEKVIVILYGSEELKEKVNNVVRAFLNKDNKPVYWTWNVSHVEQIERFASGLNIDLSNPILKKYFISDMISVLNKYSRDCDLEFSYLQEKISRFRNDEHANVLFIHNCDPKHIRDLKENEANLWEIRLGGLPDNNTDVDFQIYEGDLEREILRILRVLTKDYNTENTKEKE
jgi:hypothetical protein